jgi:hypothetical protein
MTVIESPLQQCRSALSSWPRVTHADRTKATRDNWPKVMVYAGHKNRWGHGLYLVAPFDRRKETTRHFVMLIVDGMCQNNPGPIPR